MPLIAFPGWHVAAREEDERLFRIYGQLVSKIDWEEIRKHIKIPERKFYIGPYRGDPVAFSYPGLVLGILEKAREDPLLLFPSAAVNTLDEMEFDDKAAKLEELVERAIDLDFRWFKDTDLLDPKWKSENFHPMLADAVGTAVGNLFLKSILGEDVLERCIEGDKIYASYLAKHGELVADMYEKAVKKAMDLMSEEVVKPSASEVVPIEVVEMTGAALHRLSIVITKARPGEPKCPPGTGKVEIKKISEESSRDLLKSAVERLRRLNP